jgi:nicotinate-nucleotide adenylyltransferase
VRPAHKDVRLDAETRLRLAQAAFPDARVELDRYDRTIDMLEHRQWHDPLFLIGADQFAEFLTWKNPEGVLERTRIGVGTRPGYPREQLEAIAKQLEHPDRVEFFELEPVPISSRDIRERVAHREPIDEFVPPAVAELISSLGLYRDGG